MIHAIRLGVVLYCLWLLLSGYYVALLISLGLVSTVLVTVIALRMDIVDHETYPVRDHLGGDQLLGLARLGDRQSQHRRDAPDSESSVADQSPRHSNQSESKKLSWDW